MMNTFLSLIVAMIVSLSVNGNMHAQTLDSLRQGVSYPISEAVVLDSLHHISQHLPNDISVIERAVIEHEHQASLLPVLSKQIPGLFVTGRSLMGYGVSGGASGQITMRGVGGSSPGGPTVGMAVMIDGRPQNMGLMGHPIPDAYHSMLADKVEVIHGPSSVRYGSGAMGGVVNIVTRKMLHDGVKNNFHIGYGSFNTVDANYTNRVKVGRFTSFVTGSYNRTDGHRKNMKFDQYGGYAKIGYNIVKEWDMAADVNLTHFNAQNPGTVQAPITDNIQNITRGATSLVFQNDYGFTSGAFSLSYNWGRHKINDGYKETESPKDYLFNSSDMVIGVSLYQNFSLFKRNEFTVGFDYKRFGGKAWNTFIDKRESVTSADKTMDELAGYVDMNQRFFKWFSVNAGLRYDYLVKFGSEWIPQIGLSFFLKNDIRIKAMFGKGFRFPTIREMYMFPTKNPELVPESVLNYELSFNQSILDGKLSYGATIFFIDGKNIIQTLPVDGRPQNVNSGKVKNIGVESEITWKICDKWNVLANYSYLYMKYPVVAAPSHKLFFETNLFLKRWHISTGIQYIDGLYTQVKPISKESFVLWNVNVSFKVHKIVSLYVKGENLLAQNYEINYGYPMPKATIFGGIHVDF